MQQLVTTVLRLCMQCGRSFLAICDIGFMCVSLMLHLHIYILTYYNTYIEYATCTHIGTALVQLHDFSITTGKQTHWPSGRMMRLQCATLSVGDRHNTMWAYKCVYVCCCWGACRTGRISNSNEEQWGWNLIVILVYWYYCCYMLLSNGVTCHTIE